MKITANIRINAPMDTVFDVFTDLDKLTERVEGITKVEVLQQPSSMAVGTKWRETRVMFGKEATEEMWVTELTSNKNYVVEAESHGTHYRSEYIFEQNGDGVDVTMTFEGTPLTFSAKFLGIIFSFMAKSMKGMLEKDMMDLKKICEER